MNPGLPIGIKLPKRLPKSAVRSLAATAALLRNDYSLGWTLMGVGAVLLLPVLVGRTPQRDAEEQEDAWPELAWA